MKLLCELGLFEDAVSLALAVDLELAKAVANTPEDDDGLRRKLWLSIAKHVVQRGAPGAAGAAPAGAAAEGTAAAAAAAGGDAAAAADGPDQAERIKMAVEFLKEAGENRGFLRGGGGGGACGSMWCRGRARGFWGGTCWCGG